MNVYFVDKNKFENVDYNNYLVADIKSLVEKNKNNKNAAFISIANSLLFMDGGSDLGYMKSIDNIETKAKDALKKLNFKSNCGRYYLPIGCSQLIIPENTYKFISSPSMYLPQNIQNTHNAYNCLLSALVLIHNYNANCDQYEKITDVYCPFIGTGYGKLNIDISISQMKDAIKNSQNFDNFIFLRNKDENIYISINKDLEKIKNEQPKIYMNIEFGIDINDVIKNT